MSRVAVLYGGWSHESYLCAYQRVSAAVKRLRHESLDLRCDAPEFLDALVAFKPDVAFLASHGAYHEDGKLQSILDWLDIPYIGSSACASAIGMNKPMFKRLMCGIGIATPPWLIVESGQTLPTYEDAAQMLGSTSLLLKPACAGASVGLKLVTEALFYAASLSNLVDEFGTALVERYLPGYREFSVGVNDFDGPAVALPVCELHTEGPLFDFEMKNGHTDIEKTIPANVSTSLSRQLKETAVRVHEVLGAQGASRVDFLVSPDGDVYVLEINTLPGLMPQSVLPKCFDAIGVPYDQMIERMLRAACRPKRFDVRKQRSGQARLSHAAIQRMLETG